MPVVDRYAMSKQIDDGKWTYEGTVLGDGNARIEKYGEFTGDTVVVPEELVCQLADEIRE